MTDPNLRTAVDQEDPFAVAEAADLDKLERLKVAEDVFERRYSRKRRSSRIAIASQALVGYVALGGFFANAYQNYNNKIEAQRRGDIETERWNAPPGLNNER